MAAKGARGRKLTKPMAYHVFRYIDGDKLLTVMHGNRMPHKVWRNHRGSRPRLDNFFRACGIELLDFLEELRMDVRTFFEGSRHSYLVLPDLRLLIISFWEGFLGLRVFLPLA